MSKVKASIFAATLGLACAAVLASAQTAPKPKAPAATQTPPAPAKSSAPAACPQCPCDNAKMDQPGMDKGGMMQGGGMMMHSMKDDRHAHHRELAALADIKVQNTKPGATIQFIAKNPADATKVQELAKDIAAYLSEPDEHGHPGPKH